MLLSPRVSEGRTSTASVKQDATVLDQAQAALLQAQIATLRQILELVNNELVGVKRDRDNWRDQVSSLRQLVAAYKIAHAVNDGALRAAGRRRSTSYAAGSSAEPDTASTSSGSTDQEQPRESNVRAEKSRIMRRLTYSSLSSC